MASLYVWGLHCCVLLSQYSLDVDSIFSLDVDSLNTTDPFCAHLLKVGCGPRLQHPIWHARAACRLGTPYASLAPLPPASTHCIVNLCALSLARLFLVVCFV